MAKHQVTFKVKLNGDIDYLPGLLKADKGDDVSWHCKEGDFSVEFQGISPFDNARYESTAGIITDKKIRPDTVSGQYHYNLNGVERGSGKHFGTHHCPEIDIP